MKRYTYIILSALCCACTSFGETEKLLSQLDDALAERPVYESHFLERLNSQKGLASLNIPREQLYEINKKIAREYSAYSLDSTVAYLNRNLELSRRSQEGVDRTAAIESDLLLAKRYALAGYHVEASGILSAFDYSDIPEALKKLYFSAHLSLAGELVAYSRNDLVYHEYFWQRETYRDSLLNYVDKGTFEWYELKRDEAVAAGNGDDVFACSSKMLELALPNSNDYAKACYYYSNCLSDTQEKIQWMARSAIADMMCATKDYAALVDLSKMLYSQGELERPFRYIADYAMQDAIAYGGKLRPFQIASVFPVVQKDYATMESRHNARINLLIAVISTLLALLVIVVAILCVRQRILTLTKSKLEQLYLSIEKKNDDLASVNRRLEEMNAKMKESERVKQEYLASFLGILSENINVDRQYKSHVLKYIRRGNEKYLADEIEALPPIEEDIQKFYKMFDETFVNIYPDFVEQFNALLAPGEAILPKDNDILTPELRIFALVKLGISDSSKIALLLHYSSNTIYNYRAKVKNKARGDRNAFEDAVRNIV